MRDKKTPIVTPAPTPGGGGGGRITPTPSTTPTDTPAATSFATPTQPVGGGIALTTRQPEAVRFVDGQWMYIDEYDTPLGAIPLTGDASNWLLWIGAAIVPLIGISAAMTDARRRRKLKAIGRFPRMVNEQRRHDITDEAWTIIKPHTIGNKGSWGGNARDTRLFINGVSLILRTGALWRNLPPEYGGWKNVHRRFCRLREKRIWERILEALIDEPDLEWLMIDASHIKVHPRATGAVAGNQNKEHHQKRGGLVISSS